MALLGKGHIACWSHGNETYSIRGHDSDLPHGFTVHPEERRALSEDLTNCREYKVPSQEQTMMKT